MSNLAEHTKCDDTNCTCDCHSIGIKTSNGGTFYNKSVGPTKEELKNFLKTAKGIKFLN